MVNGVDVDAEADNGKSDADDGHATRSCGLRLSSGREGCLRTPRRTGSCCDGAAVATAAAAVAAAAAATCCWL